LLSIQTERAVNLPVAEVDIVVFVTAVAFCVALYTWIALKRDRGGAWIDKVRLMRLHHVAVGMAMGYTCLSPLRSVADMGIPLVVAFLCSWFAMAVGGAVDLRMLRKVGLNVAIVELTQLALLVLLLLLLIYAPENEMKVSTMVLWAIGGVSAASWPQQRWSEKKRLSSLTPHWMPSVAILGGILLLGIGSMQTRIGPPIFIYQPFSNSLLVDGFGERILGSIALGALVGLLVDLATRGARTNYFPYMVAGGLMLGTGIGSSVAFDPLWVGAFAGFWLINTTLRRVEVLALVEGGTGGLKAAVYIVTGWMLGVQCMQWEINAPLFFWTLLLLLLLPAIRLMGWRIAGESIGGNEGYIQWFALGDFALVAALSLTTFVDPASGAALLSALLLGKVVFAAGGRWLTGVLVGLLENREKRT
jgi:hypothetical protein